MRFGGLQKSSLIDYPDRVACVVFATGCNFHCPYCHNPALAREQYVEAIAAEDFFAFLKQRRGFLDAAVISGGEPTLQPNLPDLCRRIRKMGFSVKLDTNGSRPRMLRYLLEERLLDYVAMDIKTLPECYTKLCSIKGIEKSIEKSISLVLSSGVDHEFRTTCVRPFVDSQVITTIAQRIAGARRYFLQRFSDADETLDPLLRRNGNCRFTTEELRSMKEKAALHVRFCALR